MSFRIDLDYLLQGGQLLNRVRDRMREMRSAKVAFGPCDGVLVSRWDFDKPGFDQLFDVVAGELGVSGLRATPWSLGAEPVPPEVSGWRHAWVFVVGAVSGWSLRQLRVAVSAALVGHHGRTVNGLVLHARPTTKREWTNVEQSFEGRLHTLYTTYLPWGSPLVEEAVHLQQVPLSSASLSAEARAFHEERRELCQPRERQWLTRLRDYEGSDGTPDPRAVLWGVGARGGQTHVRGKSLYGTDVDCLHALVAVGSAVHARRLSKNTVSPRAQMFEMPAIVRSYFDGVIVASILRWLEPREAWWGESSEDARGVVAELVARTADPADQKVLVPELLLAASQGKLPVETAPSLIDLATVACEDWPSVSRAAVELGIALCKEALLLEPRS